MKLEDFKKLKQGINTSLQRELQGFIGEQFFVHKELVIQLTDEEQKELAHDFVQLDSSFILSVIKDELATIQRIGVRHE